MSVERTRRFLLTLPDVVETMQWGANVVFWLGDKAIGGKMFALADLDGGNLSKGGRAIFSYLAGPERYPDLLEREGIFPAPYLARAHWVAVERWDLFRAYEWEDELRAAHSLTLAKLAPKTRKVLALSKTEQKRAIAEARKKLAAKARVV